MDKKLRLSKKNKVLAGVCGGIAEYINADPTLVRIIWVLAAFLSVINLPTAVVLYIVLWAIMPLED